MFEPIPPSSLLKIYKGCSNCRTQKIKCNGQEPCARCRAFGLQCQYIVLPNQAAHRLASLAATTTTASSSSSPALLPSTTSSPTLSSTVSTTSTTPNATSTNYPTDSSPSQSLFTSSARSPSSKTRAKKEKKRRAPSTRTPSQYDEFEASDVASSRSSQDPSTLASAQSPGTPNLILRAIVDATDPIYSSSSVTSSSSSSFKDEPPSLATVEEMSRLIGLYLRYLHPVQRLVDENGSDFWTRLQTPLEPGVASVVYAMCTMGAVFETKVPTAGLPDDLTMAYFKRTCFALDQGPEDMTTVQALLIMVPFYAVSNQEEEGQKAYSRSYNVAEKIQLGDAAMRLSTQEKLSAKDVEIRNAWRSLVWLETIANLTLLRSGPIELSKDLAGASLVPRPEEVPTSKTSIADTFAYHLCNLMKLFQSISKIKLPMSPRDVHAVTSILDSFGAWHSALPKSLRAHSSKGVSSSKSPFSPHAAILDLYYRLGQILLLNNLPQSTRSSPTGLGPRRESPLRTLATCANGITATIGDLLKSADLKNYCLSHGVRCLTEAATIQMANTRESDPSISTPAKVNLMKTLWCIRQINFGLPADKLSAILDSFDASKATAPEADIESRDIRVSLSRRSVSSRPRTSSISAMSLDSPQLSTMSLAKRATSQTSDQDFAASDGSMLEGLARARSQLASPTHDISASSLLSLSLESPSAARRSLPLAGLAGLQVEPLDREAPYRVREYLLSRRDQILEGGQEQDEDIKLSGRDSRLADRSRSSSFSVFSPRTESSTSSMVSMSEVQSSRPTFQPVTTQAWEAAEFVQPSPSHEYPPLTPYSDPLPSEENMSQKYGVVFGTRDPKYQEERKGPINPPPPPPGRTTLEYDDTVQSLLTSRYGQPQWRPPFSPTDPSLRRSSTTIPHPGALMSSLQDRDHIPSKSVTDVQGAYPVRQDLAPTSRPGPSEYPVSRSQAYFDMSHNVKQGEPHTSPPHTSWSTHPLEAKQLQRTMSGSRPHGPRDDTFHAHDSNFTPPVVSSTFQGSSSTGRFRPPSRQGSQRTRASSLTMAQRTGPPGPSRALDTSRFGAPGPDSSRFGAPEQLMHPSRRGSTRHHPLDGPEDMLTSPAAVRPYVDTHRASASRSLPIDIGSVALTSDPSESVVGGRKSDPAIPGYPSQDTSGHPIASAHGFGFSMGSRGRKRPSLSMYGGDNQELSVSGFTSGVGDRGRSGSNVELMNHGTRHLQRQQHDPHMTQPILSPDEEQFRHAQPRLYDQYQQQRREMQQRELQLHLLRLQQEQPGSSMATSSTMQTPQYTPSPYPSYDPMELHPSIYAPNYYEHPANYPRQTPQQQSAYPPSYPSQQQQQLHQLPPQQLRPDQGPVRPDRGDEALADVPRDPIRRKYR